MSKESYFFSMVEMYGAIQTAPPGPRVDTTLPSITDHPGKHVWFKTKDGAYYIVSPAGFQSYRNTLVRV